MKIIPFFVLFCFPVTLFCQTDSLDNSGDAFRLVFYNVENFFDWENDSLTNDDAFTPDGDNHWTEWRFDNKKKKLAQTLIAAGGWNGPAIIGLCEIENRFVLEELAYKTVLSSANYKIIHQNSSDFRGIDVAMLYKPELFDVRYVEYVRVKFDEPDARPTRDILYVKGIVDLTDTLHVFVNHWPSRYGGHLATDPKRMAAALTVRHKVDSIFAVNPSANIVITGDFNDHPEDRSILEGLQAQHEITTLKKNELYNLMYARRNKEGTHKFAGEWGVLDMWIVSDGLIRGEHGLQTNDNSVTIFKADFLLEDENVHLGKRPFRTYQGPAYHGGFSDHLPIVLDLKKVE